MIMPCLLFKQQTYKMLVTLLSLIKSQLHLGDTLLIFSDLIFQMSLNAGRLNLLF